MSREYEPTGDLSPFSLGSILLSAGLISRDVLEVAVEASHGLNVRLGQVLIDTNKISKLDLENALTAQCFLCSGYLDESLCRKALLTSHQNNTRLCQVLHFERAS